jgi:hypothetical protein
LAPVSVSTFSLPKAEAKNDASSSNYGVVQAAATGVCHRGKQRDGKAIPIGCPNTQMAAPSRHL